jgi:hypothetical protein
MPFAKALVRAGSLEALLARLREGAILAWCSAIYYWPSAQPASGPRDIPPDWWTDARVDPAIGRVILTVPGSRIISPGQTPPPRRRREVFAMDIELEVTALETLFPIASTRVSGGRDPDHDWEGAARHVDDSVAAKGPLPRRKNGEPNKSPAVTLMTEWFKTNQPPAPERETIYRWLRENPHPAWWL